LCQSDRNAALNSEASSGEGPDGHKRPISIQKELAGVELSLRVENFRIRQAIALGEDFD